MNCYYGFVITKLLWHKLYIYFFLEIRIKKNSILHLALENDGLKTLAKYYSFNKPIVSDEPEQIVLRIPNIINSENIMKLETCL